MLYYGLHFVVCPSVCHVPAHMSRTKSDKKSTIDSVSMWLSDQFRGQNVEDQCHKVDVSLSDCVYVVGVYNRAAVISSQLFVEKNSTIKTHFWHLAIKTILIVNS